jgi:hypothetical protein
VRDVTRGPEIRGFPPPERLPLLISLGQDYVAVLVHDLSRGLSRQGPGTRILGVRCEATPEIAVRADRSGAVRAYDAGFPLQVFVQDGAGRPWRLRGMWTYVGRDLGTRAASITHYWKLLAADGV